MRHGSVSSYEHKVLMEKEHIFRGTDVCYPWGQIKTLRTSQTKAKVKQIFFILKTLVPLWPSYKFPCLYPTSGIFGHSQDFTSDWLLANKWAQEGSHWFSQYEVVSACLHHTIFRGWAFQIHNFNFLFLFLRVNCNKL